MKLKSTHAILLSLIFSYFPLSAAPIADDFSPAGPGIGSLSGTTEVNEDLDGDGNLDVAEDVDGDGNLDVAEDVDGDGNLDVAEDLDGDGNLDIAEDVDGDGRLDFLV